MISIPIVETPQTGRMATLFGLINTIRINNMALKISYLQKLLYWPYLHLMFAAAPMENSTLAPTLAPVLKNAMPAIVNVAVQGVVPEHL